MYHVHVIVYANKDDDYYYYSTENIVCSFHQIRSDDWEEALLSQRRLLLLSSYDFSKNFYHHQVQLNGNFRLNLSIVFILSSFDVVFFSIWRIAILYFLRCPLY